MSAAFLQIVAVACLVKPATTTTSARAASTTRVSNKPTTTTTQETAQEETEPVEEETTTTTTTSTTPPPTTTSTTTLETTTTTTTTTTTLPTTTRTTTQVTTTTTTTMPTTTATTTTTMAPTASTTTPPRVCNNKSPFANCPAHNCKVGLQPSNFDQKGVLIVTMNPSGDGFYLITCGRLYFFGTIAKSWAIAQEDCCMRNMHLAAFETLQEQGCVRDNLVRKPLWYSSSPDWWVGGTDYCREDTYLWCYQNMSVSLFERASIPFNVGEPNNALGDEHCLQISPILKWGINDNFCYKSYNYICEALVDVTPPKPKCPNCVSNSVQVAIAADAFSAAAQPYVKDDLTFNVACGTKYLLVQKNMTWEVAFAECCKFGLRPLDISSEAELQCVKTAFPSVNVTWWTSGTSEGPLSESNHHFCSADVAVGGALWMADQPAKPWTNRCVAVKLDAPASGLVDADCKAPLQGVVCKAP